MIRRYGAAPRARRAYTPRHGAYAIIMRGRDVLLTFQSDPRPEFQLPGGGIDPGEGALRALHREVLEETGWRIADPVRLGAHRRFTYMPDYDMHAEKVCHIYRARAALRRSAPLEDGHSAVWLDARMALSLIATEGDAAFLSRALDLIGTVRDDWST